MNKSKQSWTGINKNEQGWTGMDKNEQEQTREDKNCSKKCWEEILPGSSILKTYCKAEAVFSSGLLHMLLLLAREVLQQELSREDKNWQEYTQMDKNGRKWTKMHKNWRKWKK